MKIAIVGSSGYIAGFLIKAFEQHREVHDIVKIDQNCNADIYLNLQEANNFNYALLNDIDYVVFTAAISGPDRCADEFDFCWSINVIGTAYFIQEAIKRKCRVLFFSSDAVFGDAPGAIYTETSETKANTPYGRMKKAIEDQFKDNYYFKAIRLSYVVSAKDRFVSYCLDCIRKGNDADVFHPFYRNCIAVSDVVNVVEWFAVNWDEYTPGVLNVAGKELVSRVRIADEINRILDYKLRYTISSPDETFYRNRPQITQMKSIYMQEYKILSDNTFTEKLQQELEGIKYEY